MIKIFVSIFFLTLHCTLCSQNIDQINTGGVKDTIDYYIDSAGVLANKFEFKKSMDKSYKGIELALLKNDSLKLAILHNIIGNNFTQLKDFNSSRKFYFKALSYLQNSKEYTTYSWIYNNLANTYIKKEELDTSFKYYEESLKFAKKAGDPKEIYTPILNIAWAYLDVDYFNKALPYLKECEVLIKKHHLTDEDILAQFHFLYARYYNFKNSKTLFKHHLDKAFHHASNKELFSELMDINKMYSSYYESQQDYKKSLSYFKAFFKFKEQVFEEKSKQSNFIANSKYEIEEYKSSAIDAKLLNESQSLIVKRTKQTLIASVISILILSVLLLNLFKNYKFRIETIKVLEEKNNELKLSKEAADNLSKEKSQYLSTVSHEIRTPLYGVVGLTSILSNEYPELLKNENLKALRFSANHLLELINDVLQINKMDDSKIVLEKIPFTLKSLFNNVVSSVKVILEKNNNTCKLDLDPEIPLLLGDSVRLTQVLINLVANAAKFTKNGDIVLKAKLLKNEHSTCTIYVEVSDTGVGIPQHQLPIIFNKFTQIKGEIGSFSGTGLGLPIVKGILNLFNSEIQVKSKEGKGSTFYFTIVLDGVKEQGIEEKKQKLTEIIPSNYHIHIVEDNHINQIVTKKVLLTKGYRCSVSSNGTEAIKNVTTNNFDLVLMDINMPDMSGIEATLAIKKIKHQVPILALTASDDVVLKQEILASGMIDIILKPYDLEHFYQTLLKHLANHPKKVSI